MNFPSRAGNFLESSATGLFAYAVLRGLRLGYLGTVDSWRDDGDEFSAEEYRRSAERAYEWLVNNALLDLGDGTVGYNLTVDVCSINSTTAFDVSRLFSFCFLSFLFVLGMFDSDLGMC